MCGSGFCFELMNQKQTVSAICGEPGATCFELMNQKQIAAAICGETGATRK